ncbi:MAG: hypothetical protein RIR62_2319 [Pseudomonadota bacterium]|jgi:iron(III) transport system ATP-binding protein
MLAVNPNVLLLDEPLSNLDARLRLEMRAELKRLHAEFRTTIVFVTHDQWEAMTLATSIAVMSEGRLQQVGTPNDIYDRPANRFVAEFVGSPPINIVEMASDTGFADAARRFLSDRFPALDTAGSIGLRPEAIAVSERAEDVPAGAFSGEATVTGVLPTGGSWILELNTAGAKLFATTHVPPRIKDGAKARFWVEPAALHVFAADGNRIAQADALLAAGPDLTAGKKIA